MQSIKEQLADKLSDPQWKQRYEELNQRFYNEPTLMSGRRVNQILDVGNTTRFKLYHDGKLHKVKLGDKMQNPSKYSKESVIMLLVDWELNPNG